MIFFRYLDYALAHNSTEMMVANAKMREAKDSVWNFIIENWDNFMAGSEERCGLIYILKY